jgi:hypothetical protein
LSTHTNHPQPRPPDSGKANTTRGRSSTTLPRTAPPFSSRGGRSRARTSRRTTRRCRP